MILRGKNAQLDLSCPRIMGVLNVTPDSFSDGGCFNQPDKALSQARRMITEGADLLDIGGESTRPGAAVVGPQEELDRVIPIIDLVRRETAVPISIDTNKAVVAQQALDAGANFINDISGLSFDPQMAAVAACTGAGLFLMHTSGRPQVMQYQTEYGDILQEVQAFLLGAAAQAQKAGVAKDAIALDPGIGFGKGLEGNLQLLQHLDTLVACGYPLLLGTSRKSFIGAIVEQPNPAERLAGTLATLALGVKSGARIFRVHDVKPAREAALVAWAVCEGRFPVSID